MAGSEPTETTDPSLSPAAGPSQVAGAAQVTASTSVRQDAVTVLFAACLTAGAMSDGWAHQNVIETIEGFFTPWHGLLYAGFAATAAWTCWLAYQRRSRAPRWWRDGWPRGYRVGAVGMLLFLAGGLADLVWHETLGVEVGLDASFSPSHLLLDVGAVLLVTSPLRSWWATGEGGARTVTGVGSLVLGTMAPVILLTHSLAFLTAAPTVAPLPGAGLRLAVLGVDAYLVTTLLLVVPFLLVHRRRAVPGTGTALVAGVALFAMVMHEFPAPLATAALAALGGAVLADLAVTLLDNVRGPGAPLRLPLAGALLAALVWSGHLVGLHLAAEVRWTPEVAIGVVVLTAVLGSALGGLAAGPAGKVAERPSTGGRKPAPAQLRGTDPTGVPAPRRR